MAKKGQRISPDLKQEILKEADEKGVTPTADRFQIHEQTIYRWKQQQKADNYQEPIKTKSSISTHRASETEPQSALALIQSLRKKALELLLDIEKLREKI